MEVKKPRIIPIKVVLIGDGAVGKTTLRKRYMGEYQTTSYIRTLGADFAKKTVHLHVNNEEIRVEAMIWDLAGQEQFELLRSHFYEGSRAGIMVFDSTRRETFETAQKWLKEMWDNCGNDGKPVPTVFLSNKEDIREESGLKKEDIEEMIDKIRNWARELYPDCKYEYPFMYTSAVTGFNVDKAFELVLTEVFKE